MMYCSIGALCPNSRWDVVLKQIPFGNVGTRHAVSALLLSRTRLPCPYHTSAHKQFLFFVQVPVFVPVYVIVIVIVFVILQVFVF